MVTWPSTGQSRTLQNLGAGKMKLSVLLHCNRSDYGIDYEIDTRMCV